MSGDPPLATRHCPEYLICADCGTEAFAWIAEIFACPVCNGCDYVEWDSGRFDETTLNSGGKRPRENESSGEEGNVSRHSRKRKPGRL
ncbi:hypothetical protein K504DRAFT_507766 [Pleomassaria siparia CBS 279.74]|uniref:Uncharacterized protein n=1 Tax=Pleomassaria siparia CBS 279.74 TaxID=1314801 RepID=A0A6G1JUC7_9PLEO|nr:hypothetical protein K504DRAFT_507766 [Pleomassaria siparia CBS 279.74]